MKIFENCNNKFRLSSSFMCYVLQVWLCLQKDTTLMFCLFCRKWELYILKLIISIGELFLIIIEVYIITEILKNIVFLQLVMLKIGFTDSIMNFLITFHQIYRNMNFRISCFESYPKIQHDEKLILQFSLKVFYNPTNLDKLNETWI